MKLNPSSLPAKQDFIPKGFHPPKADLVEKTVCPETNGLFMSKDYKKDIFGVSAGGFEPSKRNNNEIAQSAVKSEQARMKSAGADEIKSVHLSLQSRISSRSDFNPAGDFTRPKDGFS